MQRLLFGVRIITVISVFMFLISCYYMIVKSETTTTEHTTSTTIPKTEETSSNPAAGGEPSKSAAGGEPSNSAAGGEPSKSGALTIVQQDDAENDATVAIEDDDLQEESDFGKLDVFYPTKEWQAVKPGQAIPSGLHVRLNLETGQREAKLMDGDDGMKYWKEGNKQVLGMVNTEKEFFTHDDLKRALKEFKVNKIDDEDLERAKNIKQKFKSYEELRKDMAGMKMDVKTDREIILELTDKLNSSIPDTDGRLDIMEALVDYLHQIDNAILFCDIGGMKIIIKSLNDTDSRIRAKSASLLATALQNNPKVKIFCMEAGVLHHFVRALSTEQEKSVKHKILYATSAFIRNFPYAQIKFLDLGGFSVLGSLFSPANEDISYMTKTREKTIQLIVDLVNEHDSVVKEDSQVVAKDMLNQYKQIPIRETCLNNGFCDIISRFLENINAIESHATKETILNAVLTLLDPCLPTFQRQSQIVQTVRDDYLHLSQQNHDLDFYKELYDVADKVLSSLTTKDEL